MRRGEAKDSAMTTLFYEHQQTRVYGTGREGYGVAVRIARPEREKSTGLGRRSARGPDMPVLLANSGKPRLVVTVLRFRRH